MKIEIGESLMYSWLRHVQGCQIVQTNWKASKTWPTNQELSDISSIMDKIDLFFESKYGYNIFKSNSSIQQLLYQGECDLLGISIDGYNSKLFAAEVAFHEGGLNYGSKEVTVMKVLEKFARTAFCVSCFFYRNDADILFATPKINPSVISGLLPAINDLSNLFSAEGLSFNFTLIANEDFQEQILNQVLSVSSNVADTNELFLRSYQLINLFPEKKFFAAAQTMKTTPTQKARAVTPEISNDEFPHLKVGQLAQRVLGKMLQDGLADENEISLMQNAMYSKKVFDLQYPLLIKAEDEKSPVRYYKTPLTIGNCRYYMCSEWFEQNGGNNDRPYLLKWIAQHQKKESKS